LHKKVSYGGIATALAVLLLALSAYFPTGKAATLFASSAMVYAYRRISGVKAAFAMYAATAVLAFFLTAGAFSLITASFIICFGNYPVIRYFTENQNIVLKVAVRAALYSIYFAVVYGVVKYFMPAELPFSVLILYLAGAVAFTAYDVLLKYTGIYLEQLFYRIKR